MSFIAKCPHCIEVFESEDEWEGLEATCPTCGKDLTITREPEELPPEDTPAETAQQDSTGDDIPEEEPPEDKAEAEPKQKLSIAKRSHEKPDQGENEEEKIAKMTQSKVNMPKYTGEEATLGKKEAGVEPPEKNTAGIAPPVKTTQSKLSIKREKVPEPPTIGGKKTCPGCGGPVDEDSVICTECGFNMKTGEKPAETGGSSGFIPKLTNWKLIASAVFALLSVSFAIWFFATGPAREEKRIYNEAHKLKTESDSSHAYANAVYAYQRYLKKYPEGKFADEAKNAISELEQNEVDFKYETIKKNATAAMENNQFMKVITFYQQYCKQNPEGQYFDEAQKEIKGEWLLEKIQSEDPKTRKAALVTLDIIGHQNALSEWKKALDDSDTGIQNLAINRLVTKEKDPAAINKLIEKLAAIKSDKEKIPIVRMLGGTGSPDIAEPLLPMLKTKNPTLKTEVIKALGKSENPKVIAPLTVLLKKKMSKKMLERTSKKYKGKDAKKYLKKDNQNFTDAMVIVEALGNTRNKEALSPLLKILKVFRKKSRATKYNKSYLPFINTLKAAVLKPYSPENFTEILKLIGKLNANNLKLVNEYVARLIKDNRTDILTKAIETALDPQASQKNKIDSTSLVSIINATETMKNPPLVLLTKIAIWPYKDASKAAINILTKQWSPKTIEILVKVANSKSENKSYALKQLVTNVDEIKDTSVLIPLISKLKKSPDNKDLYNLISHIDNSPEAKKELEILLKSKKKKVKSKAAKLLKKYTDDKNLAKVKKKDK